MYNEKDADADMSEIISVSRASDELLLSVDEYFRSEHSKQAGFLQHKDALFAITFMVRYIVIAPNYIASIALLSSDLCFILCVYFLRVCLFLCFRVECF